MARRPPALFVTAPDTDQGKTFAACAIARRLVAAGLTVGVYKPVASGCRPMTGDDGGGTLVADDAVALWEAAGRPGRLEDVCPQRFAAPLSPPRAAAAEGRRVDPTLLRTGFDVWAGRSDVVLVEGAGGLMSPISDEDFNADLALDLRLPVLVVAANRLGTIGLTLMTLIAASTFGDGLAVEGILLTDVDGRADDASRPTNAADLAALAAPPVLGVLPHGAAELPASPKLEAWLEKLVRRAKRPSEA